jgi:hypothetical protein
MDMADDLLKIAELFDRNSGWFINFLVYVVAVGIVATLVIHLVRFAKGKVDWLGRVIEEQNPSATQMVQIQLELCRKEHEELELKLLRAETERAELMKQLKVKEEELIEKEQKLAELIQELDVLKGLYEELDARYDDETYTTSQIMYTADEIAIAIADSVLFEENRDDIYMNLLPHLEHNRFRSCATPCPPHCQKQVVHIPSRVENNHSNEHNETGHPAFPDAGHGSPLWDSFPGNFSWYLQDSPTWNITAKNNRANITIPFSVSRSERAWMNPPRLGCCPSPALRLPHMKRLR